MHAWIIITNHVYLILSSETAKIEHLVRDSYKYSSAIDYYTNNNGL